jgi:hypothetical protein
VVAVVSVAQISAWLFLAVLVGRSARFAQEEYRASAVYDFVDGFAFAVVVVAVEMGHQWLQRVAASSKRPGRRQIPTISQTNRRLL